MHQVIIRILLLRIGAGCYKGSRLGLPCRSTVSSQMQLAAAKAAPSTTRIDTTLISGTTAGQMPLLLTYKTGGKGKTGTFPRLTALPQGVLIGTTIITYSLSSLRTVLDRMTAFSTLEADLGREGGEGNKKERLGMSETAFPLSSRGKYGFGPKIS